MRRQLVKNGYINNFDNFHDYNLTYVYVNVKV